MFLLIQQGIFAGCWLENVKPPFNFTFIPVTTGNPCNPVSAQDLEITYSSFQKINIDWFCNNKCIYDKMGSDLVAASLE